MNTEGGKPRAKILVVTPTFFPTMGGAERGIYEIYKRLSHRYEVHILSPYLKGSSETIWPPGIESASFTMHQYVDRINLLKVKGQRLLWGLVPPFSISMARATQQLVDHIKPDVANVHYAIPSGLAVHVLRNQRIPVVLS